jgi:hypothetical protein
VRALQNGYRWVVNNRTQFAEDDQPSIPFLVQYYSVPKSQRHPNYTLALENGGLDPVHNLYPAKLGEVLDIVVQNLAGPTVIHGLLIRLCSKG